MGDSIGFRSLCRVFKLSVEMGPHPKVFLLFEKFNEFLDNQQSIFFVVVSYGHLHSDEFLIRYREHHCLTPSATIPE